MNHPNKKSKSQTEADVSPLPPGLYVVATPIGNLGDITARSRDILSRADLVLAEDRRMASRLLQHVGASTQVSNYSDHNAARVRPGILSRLAEGEAIALTSDAGTPLISDPGYKLVDEARAQGSRVHAVPGPSALTAALSVSGLPTDRFLFLGFLPPKSAARMAVLKEVGNVKATLVSYESPRRLTACLKDMMDALGTRPAAVARELTKLHEEVRRGTLPELWEYYQQVGEPRGEIVLLVGWSDEAASDGGGGDLDSRLTELIAEMPLRDAVDLAASDSGLKRREVYRRALELRDAAKED